MKIEINLHIILNLFEYRLTEIINFMKVKLEYGYWLSNSSCDSRSLEFSLSWVCVWYLVKICLMLILIFNVYKYFKIGLILNNIIAPHIFVFDCASTIWESKGLIFVYNLKLQNEIKILIIGNYFVFNNRKIHEYFMTVFLEIGHVINSWALHLVSKNSIKYIL